MSDEGSIRITQFQLADDVKVPMFPGHSKVVSPGKGVFRDLRVELDLLDRGLLVYANEQVTLIPFTACRQVTWIDENAVAARKERRAAIVEEARQLQEAEEAEAVLAREKAREEAEEFQRLQDLRSVKADEQLARAAREEAKEARKRAMAMEQSQIDRMLATKQARQNALDEQAHRMRQDTHLGKDRRAQVRAEAQAQRAKRAATRERKKRSSGQDTMNEPAQGPPAGPDSGA